MNAPSHRKGRDEPGSAAFFIAAVLIAFAPLFRGGNRPFPLLVLELVALAGLAVALLPARSRERIPMGAVVFAALVALIPLLHLVPLPLEAWSGLAGRAPFAEVIRAQPGTTTHTLSVIPFETEYAGLALLPPLAAFLLGIQLRLPHVIRILQLLVAVAAIEAVLGLIQYGSLGGGVAGMRASGTYVNPNHFAGLMLMVLPVALMGLAVEIGDRTRDRKFGRGLLGALKRTVASKGTKVLVAVAVIVLLLMAIVFSRSRAGIMLAALGVAITTITAAPRIGGPRAYGVMGLVLAVVVGFAAAIGLIPVIDRFAAIETLEDDRWPMILAAVEMAGRYFPVGAGMGTFAALYPPFQPPEILALVHRAHNDYVEWVAEAGLLALLAIGLAFALFVMRLVTLRREQDKHRVHYLQVGAAIGVLLMALHSLVDFNLRIPANAIVFALLAGVLLARQQPVQLHERQHGRRAQVPIAPIPLAPVPQLDPSAAARVRAVWAVPAETAPPPNALTTAPFDLTPSPSPAASAPAAAPEKKAPHDEPPPGIAGA
jgi:O-antigen ligase